MSLRKIIILIMWTALGVSAAGAAPPTYPCYQPAVAPVVDGDVAEDPAWQSIPVATGFYVLGGGYTYAKQTMARLCWTEAGLYVGVICEEPDAQLLNPQIRDGGDTWAEDGIEIFIQPAPKPDVYQFAITAGGAKGGFEGHPDITKMQAAAKRGEDFYSIETFIPWEVINARAHAGARWRGNVCRNIFVTKSGGDKFTSWAPLQARFLEPENFAYIIFYDTVLDPAQATKISEELNLAYRTTISEQVAAAAKAFGEYKDALQQATQEQPFAEAAQRLLAQWQRLEALSRARDSASVLAMRQALRELDALNKESYEIKYRYLIYKLMQEN